MLTKFIYNSKIHLNQSINYLLIQEKKLGLNMKKIPRYLLIIHKQLMMFIDYI